MTTGHTLTPPLLLVPLLFLSAFREKTHFDQKRIIPIRMVCRPRTLNLKRTLNFSRIRRIRNLTLCIP